MVLPSGNVITIVKKKYRIYIHILHQITRDCLESIHKWTYAAVSPHIKGSTLLKRKTIFRFLSKSLECGNLLSAKNLERRLL